MAVLFRALFVALVIYLIINVIRKMFQPEQSNNQQKQRYDNQQSASKMGETTIRYNNKGEKIIDKNEGEYVDFEEVD
ncbi:MAG TPA: DUF4834 family protein [Prolixibacteraceae bacterium]|nr:DUF4834 family protein [Prolixibacteraceae bacterium]